MSAKRSEALKVPKIIQTSPPKQKEGHEKYSGGARRPSGLPAKIEP
jgi:hypothetical protein